MYSYVSDHAAAVNWTLVFNCRFWKWIENHVALRIHTYFAWTHLPIQMFVFPQKWYFSSVDCNASAMLQACMLNKKIKGEVLYIFPLQGKDRWQIIHNTGQAIGQFLSSLCGDVNHVTAKYPSSTDLRSITTCAIHKRMCDGRCCQRVCPTAMGFAFVARAMDDPEAFDLRPWVAKVHASEF